eukprot:740500_1
MSISLDQILLTLVFIIFSTLIVYDNGEANIKKEECTDSEHSNQYSSNTDTTSSIKCINQHSQCQHWADLGYCQRNHTKMLSQCPISCNSCNDINWNDLKPGCPLAYPTCQNCKNKLQQCTQWYKMGECMKHPGYMVINCAKTCKYCHLQSNYSLRCPKNEQYMSQTRVFKKPGDLNAMFENIISYYNMHKNQTENDGTIEWDLQILSSDPWVLKFDNFFTEIEAKGIIDAAGTFERSTDVGQKDATGHFTKVTSTSRTSKNAWCHERCWNQPLVQQVMKRVETVLNMSCDNSEHLQILEYTKGQYYKTHHDYIPNQVHMSCGPRILTWYMYLSDVEEGGGTHFPKLGITNLPKLGRVVFWPSVLDSDPSRIDGRTYHEAQPVVNGVKYGANS